MVSMVSISMDDSDENAIIDLADSQPLFTELEEGIIMQRKRYLTSNVEDSQSQSLLTTKRSRTENSVPNIKRSLITVPQSQDTKKPQEKSALSSQNPEQENEKYECVLCNQISNHKDLRNEHYGKLISSEIQFVEPCLRTYVYVEILKLIHRNKYKHTPHNNM